MEKILKILLINSVAFTLFSGPNEDLLKAAENGNLVGVEAALDAGADVNNATEGWRITALIVAAVSGHTDIVRLLLDRGANINHDNNLGATALIVAAENGHTDTVILLLDKGADINHATDYGSTVLVYAARSGLTDIVQLLLGRGMNLNQTNSGGFTPIMVAAQQGRTDTVRLFLDRGSDINHVANDGYTALILAAENGRRDTVKLLLNRGADINAINDYGSTALSVAQRGDRTEIVKILEETPEIKQLVDNAIQGDLSSHRELIEKLKDLNIDSYEFNLILNSLINKIKDVGINRNSRKLLLDLAYHIAINLGGAVAGLLPEDILMPMLRGFLPDTDLEYEFDMMNLDAHNQPIKKNLLEIIYAFYKKIAKLEERKAELEVDNVLQYE